MSEALQEYQKAHKEGEKAVKHGEKLAVLDDIVKGTCQQIPLGVMEIPLSLVTGTVTQMRTVSFAGNYMPVMPEGSEFARKWMNVWQVQTDSGIDDPIQVKEYLGRFYVQEGNKRVSVMKYLGNPSIMADVTRVMCDDMPAVYQEFLSFYKVCPIYNIQFTKPGSYKRLAALLNRDLVTPWPADLIHTVQGGYFRFEGVYQQMKSDKVSLTPGDAFLVYLLTYQFDSLLDYSRASIARRIAGLQKELMLGSCQQAGVQMAPVDAKEKRFSLLNFNPAYSERNPLYTAFIYPTKQSDSAVSDHEIGRIYIENVFDGIVKTMVYDSCDKDEDTEAAINDAIAKGAQVIFTTSILQRTAALRQAILHPQVQIYNCSLFLENHSLHSYATRDFEVKFLMGALAAQLSNTDHIGYLVPSPVYGTAAEVNAFAIGAQMVRPDIKVKAVWADQKDVDSAALFAKENITLYAARDLIFPDRDEPEYGLCRRENGKVIHLAAPVRNWGAFYEKLIHNIIQGIKPGMHSQWWGLKSGVIDLHCADGLPSCSVRLMDALKNALLCDDFAIFSGELKDQAGNVRNSHGALDAGQILAMDWLYENVEGKIPEMHEYDEKTAAEIKQMEAQ
ncbi:MAG: BMP family ABC transporter substrate-binding protein [Lactimicrobium sp.]|jgi:basic membrane lipoprotein Med (substrate-binding protein (PBP1-ABC) superfamily)|uniref:BMP family ABC transporter substrate-binding protein n=1 Tax=Lactimicrobium sp. TaxID=2563780 RepID=UPI002F3566FF